MGFDLGNLLQQHAGHVTAADPDGVAQAFRHIVGEHPAAATAQGIAAALRSGETPPFAQLVSQLYVHSGAAQRSGLLNLLIENVSPAMLEALSGSIGQLSRNGRPQLTDAQVAEISAPQVTEIAAVAEQHDGGIIERVAAFYAGHPEVFNALESNILKIALGKMAQLH